MTTQEQSARQIWVYLTGNGWTKEAVAGVLGNMQSESGIIADRWESDIIGNMSGGYGLVQWTPAKKYIDWALANDFPYNDVISQCKRLEWEVQNNQQFYHPSMTFQQFTQSTQLPEVLADIFIRYYERPLNPDQPVRQAQARYWYNLLKDMDNTIPEKPKEEEEITMVCTYIIDKKGTIYYFDGQVVKALTSSDQAVALREIYRRNNGKEMPHIEYSSKAPFYDRLVEVTKLKAL